MNSSLTDLGLVLISISLLWKGGDWVVISALRVAQRFNLSDATVGLTVVALGTSAPEIVVTLVAAIKGQHDISVGNVVGSNIFNIGFILGGCALFCAIPTTRFLVKRDASALMVASLLVVAFLGDHVLARWEGLLMIALLGAYLVYLIQRGEEPPPEELEIGARPARTIDFIFLCVSLACVIGGASLLVYSAKNLAESIGLSEWAIGVTIVAAGTSLPELSTAVAAVRRGRSSIMAATLIGSDLFNLMFVLGLAAFFRPLEVDPASRPSILMMTVMVGILILFMRSGWRLSRTEGLLLMTMAAVRWSRDLAPELWKDVF